MSDVYDAFLQLTHMVVFKVLHLWGGHQKNEYYLDFTILDFP